MRIFIAIRLSIVILVLGFAGCGGVSRTLTVTTVPAGALVELNDEQIGVSPVTTDFNWYGDYRVRISKPGYETLDTHRQLKAPWYDGFPFDFFAMFIRPEHTEDSYQWTFELQPYQPPARNKLLEGALHLEAEALSGFERPDSP